MMTTSNEHNNAPAVPQGWPPFDELDDDLIDAACTAGSVLYRVDLMRAYECIRSALLAATPTPAPAVPQWNGACEAMKWLNEIELYQGGANGPTIKLRAAIQALATTPAPAPAPAHEVDEAQLQKLRENGAKAWAGVDANALRAGYEPAQEPVTTAEVSARYRFLMALLIDRGVLTDRRYSNGTWSLQGIALVDDSGLRGAGRTPEEAIDNAIEMARLNPNDQLTKWRETHEQIAQEVGLTDEEIFKCVQAACLDGSCPDFETFTKQELEDPVLTDFARAIIAAIRAKGAV